MRAHTSHYLNETTPALQAWAELREGMAPGQACGGDTWAAEQQGPAATAAATAGRQLAAMVERQQAAMGGQLHWGAEATVTQQVGAQASSNPQALLVAALWRVDCVS